MEFPKHINEFDADHYTVEELMTLAARFNSDITDWCAARTFFDMPKDHHQRVASNYARFGKWLAQVAHAKDKGNLREYTLSEIHRTLASKAYDNLSKDVQAKLKRTFKTYEGAYDLE